MAKKVRYSQPLAVIWDAYQETVRKSTIEVSPKRFIWEQVGNDVRNPFLDDAAVMNVQTEILISDMFYLDTEKKFLHLFFIDKSLRDFLMDLPLYDFNGLADYIIENQSYCIGTKEREFCTCGGDKRKCNFYPVK